MIASCEMLLHEAYWEHNNVSEDHKYGSTK